MNQVLSFVALVDFLVKVQNIAPWSSHQNIVYVKYLFESIPELSEFFSESPTKPVYTEKRIFTKFAILKCFFFLFLTLLDISSIEELKKHGHAIL